MSEMKTDVSEAHARGKKLYREFEDRMARLLEEGLVDCKMKISVDEDTTSAGVVMTLNNILRVRSAGKRRPLHYG